MNWKIIVTVIAASPFVALLGGVGVLAYNVSQTWDARNTDALISGLVASCGIGGIVMAGLLTAIVGIPMAMRLMDKWRESDTLFLRGWGASTRRSMLNAPLTPCLPEYREPRPPMLAAKPTQGSWQSSGVQTYTLWEDVDPAEREWGYESNDPV
jgi:hypothetical protein